MGQVEKPVKCRIVENGRIHGKDWMAEGAASRELFFAKFAVHREKYNEHWSRAGNFCLIRRSQ
jgi:hypothetical protein